MIVPTMTCNEKSEVKNDPFNLYYLNAPPEVSGSPQSTLSAITSRGQGWKFELLGHHLLINYKDEACSDFVQTPASRRESAT